MDFLITGFLLFVNNLINPQPQPEEIRSIQQRNNTDYENGAAFFFSSSQLHREEPQEDMTINSDYDGGPEW